MSNTSAGGSDLSERVLLLLTHVIEALSAKDGTDPAGGAVDKPMFFPEGIGGISVSLTVAGDTASLAISSPPSKPGKIDIFRKPPPAAHVHPMEVTPHWTDTSSATYTVLVHRDGQMVGEEQPIKLNVLNNVELGP
jgi:hypothetical protein